MKILIVDDEPELREIVAFILESRFGAEALEAPSGRLALEVIQANPDLGCVISDYNMPDGNGGELFRYLRKNHPDLPFLLCSTFQPKDCPEFQDEVPAFTVPKPFTTSQLLQAIQTATRIEAVDPNAKPATFCRVRTSALQKTNFLTCDVYLKLSDSKYVKVMHAGDPFTEADGERYHLKKIDVLYMRLRDCDTFLDRFSKEILSLSHAKQSLPGPAAMVVTQSSIEVVHELTHHLGFTPQVQELTKASVELSIRCISEDATLSRFLERLTAHPDSYITSHSSALAYVSCGVASLMSWNSEATRHKLALASFIHDLSLENDKMALDADLHGMGRFVEIYGAEAFETFVKHPEEAAKYAQQMREMPPDVDIILTQHHEQPDGTGFPYRQNYRRMSPLSSVFIVAHDLVNCSYGETPLDLKTFLERTERRYSVGHFKKIHAALKASLMAPVSV
ncbi:MAG: response regulator [Oligoflexia bacterium]|nr:response regulator [Oligoflexia bacterium]